MSFSWSLKQKDSKLNMMRFLAYVFAACFLFCALSCEKTAEPSKEKPSVSATLEDINLSAAVIETSATTATLEYNLNLEALSSMPIDVKIRYSLSESFPAEGTVVVRLNKERMSVTLTGLQFDRQYYYEVFVTLYDTEYNAEKGTFKTQSASVTLNDASESLEGLMVSGKVNGVSAADLAEFNALLYLNDVAMGNVQEHRLELAEDFTFSKIIDGLDIGATYTYRVKLNQGTQKSVSSEEMTYRTQDPYLAAEKAIVGAAIDLSESSTANCYIVPSSGVYKFKLVKGNTNESVGDVKSVRILWESFGSAVKPVALDLICATCKDGDYAVFEVPQIFNEGNAVVAAYDAQDNILWSWHIWLTAAQMQEITYANNAGVMMDRNLGSLSAEVNDPKALGLFYQWGRKDPFLGSSSIVQSLYAKSTRNLKVAANTSETSSLSYAQANPHKFILANENGDWMPAKDNSLWGATKTVYDPCPAGWRIPDGGYNDGLGEGGMKDGIWATAGIPGAGPTAFDEYDIGRFGKLFSSQFCTPDSWYPAAGSIDGNTGNLYEVSVDGVYASVTAFGGTDMYVTGLLINYLPNLNSHYIYCGGQKFIRAGGFSVRCCKE